VIDRPPQLLLHTFAGRRSVSVSIISGTVPVAKDLVDPDPATDTNVITIFGCVYVCMHNIICSFISTANSQSMHALVE